MKGHKRQRGPETWLLCVYNRRTRKYVYETFHGKARAADSAIAALVARVESGGFDLDQQVEALPDSEPLFEAMATEWLANRKRSSRVGESCYEQYEWIVRTKLVPHLGKSSLEDITEERVQELYDLLLATFAARTVRHVHGVLAQILKFARRRGRLRRDPLEAIDLPAMPPPIEAPDVEDVQEFLRTAGTFGPVWQALARLKAVTGMRRGEIGALRWQDLDLEAGQVAVHRAMRNTRRADAMKQPKTVAGVRTMRIDDTTITMLKTYRSWCDARARRCELPHLDKSAFVFSPEPDGSLPFNLTTISHQFAKIREQGTSTVRPHGLRRFSATQAAASGASLRELMGRHGWSDVRTAMRYTGYLTARDRNIADSVGGVLDGQEHEPPAE